MSVSAVDVTVTYDEVRDATADDAEEKCGCSADSDLLASCVWLLAAVDARPSKSSEVTKMCDVAADEF